MNKREVQDAIDKGLSHLEFTANHRREVLSKVKGETIMKRKLSVGLVLAIVLSLMVVTALAAIALRIYSDMQDVMQLSEQGVFERWELDDKRRFIGLMEQFGIEMDTEKLAILKANAGDEEALDQIAGEIINSVYLERSQRGIPEWVDQPEEYPVPGYFTIFEDLWLRNEPEATEEEIHAAYQAWWDEVSEPWTPEREQEMSALEEARINSIRTEEEMLAQFDSYLSEVLSFGRRERQKTTVSASFLEDLQLWKITLTIPAEDARPATIELLGYMNPSYDEEHGAYSVAFYFLPNGNGVGWNLNAYWLSYQLIPISEYPSDAGQDDVYRNFVHGTFEEKAAFSAKWKPIVDQWLAENPDMVQWLERDTGVYDAILFTRHVYGIPSEKAIPLEAAIEIAKEAYLRSGATGTNLLTNGITVVSEEMIRERCSTYFFYDSTDEDNPLWKITFNYAAWHNVLPEDNTEGYHVIMDAFTGQILNEYTYAGSGRYEGGLNSFQYAEEFL